MEGYIIMSRKELRRLRILEHVKTKVMTLADASKALDLSYRQAKRVWHSYKLSGAKGIIHGNRGREPANKTESVLGSQIVKKFQDRYSFCNDTHYTEFLLEDEGIKISRETVRKILRGAGISPKHKRRPKQHHHRRERKEQPGSMMLWDGSPHRWFGEDKPLCCLMASVDDATSKLLGGRFVNAEGSIGYLKLLEKILLSHGIPVIAYHDRHSSLVRVDNEWSIEEELLGRQFPTHVGRVFEELGIRSIPAYSAQAKGRIERAFRTLQDRLIAELKLNKIRDMEKANLWMESTFIKRYNKRFEIKPQNQQTAFLPITKEEVYKMVSFAYEATVGNDNCVRLGGLRIDIPAGKNNQGYSRQRVFVRQHLDGSWSVWLKDKVIAKHPSTELREPIRQWKYRTTNSKQGLRNIKSAVQVYISSKPASSPKGHFPFAVKGTY